LLHGFADRRMQEFFLEKNYPPTSDLERVAAALTEEYVPVDALQRKLKLDRDTLDRAIEKLLAQGVALMDMAGDVCGTGEMQWQSGYEAQVANRRAQIDRMVAFAESTTCRMAALVRHFGDTSDKALTCGMCDVCNPSGNSASAAHQPTTEERGWLRTILRALEGRSTSTGKLFTDLHLTPDRSDFDALLDGLARAGLISLANDTFTTPEGKDVTYRKASITHEGRDPDEATLDTVWIRGSLANAPAKKKRSESKKARNAAPPQKMNPEAEALFERLRAWRTEQARPTKTPAFMILADAVMRSIANHAPTTIAELLAVPGMGPAKVDRYGAAVLAVCRGDSPAPTVSVPPKLKVERNVASSEAPVRTTNVSAVQQKSKPAPSEVVALTPEQEQREEHLKQWRRAVAKAAGLPTFFIFSDTVLREIAVVAPASMQALQTLRGVGQEKAEKFGAAVLEIVHR
jgi:ATP-dependent DNA helicase RecQ